MSGKAEDKAELQRMCGLEERPDTPIIAMVSRLAAHKGFDLVMRILDELIKYNDVQFVLLGTGDFAIENYFRDLERRYPGKVCAMLEYNKALSKKIYAGADMFLMPSKSEPCGLAQMIASRYATVPVVRRCGGLADTIYPFNEYTGEGNGFSFNNYNAHDMKNVIDYALLMYKDKEKWKTVMNNAITTDFSWAASAGKYIELYKKIIRK